MASGLTLEFSPFSIAVGSLQNSGLCRFLALCYSSPERGVQTFPALEVLPFCGMRCVCSPELPAPTGALNSPTNIDSCNRDPHPGGQDSKSLCPTWLFWHQDALTHPLLPPVDRGEFLKALALFSSHRQHLISHSPPIRSP